MSALSLFFGVIVGFSLGLTGGGGSIFGVPLLVYGLGVGVREAVGTSLAAVGAIAVFGALRRLRAGQIETRAGLLFAAAGMAGAPLGTWVGRRIPEEVLLVLFAGLTLFTAARLWRKAATRPQEARIVRAYLGEEPQDDSGPVCRRDPEGLLRLTGPCVVVMSLVGLLTGVISGVFGVGGGFAIVPALVFFTSMDVHRAVSTSLLVIALVSSAGVASYLLAGQALTLSLALSFVAGGVMGMELGGLLGRRLSGPRLQKVFALAMIGMALFIASRHLLY